MYPAKDIDWARIEVDYSAGMKTLREIASEHGITHAAIQKRAKRDNWVRDVTPRIQKKADDLVASRAVAAKVTKRAKKAMETQVIEANAEIQADIQTGHRASATKTRAIADKMLTELEAMIDDKDLLETIAEFKYNPDARGNDAMNDIYRKVIAFPGRSKALRDVADTLKMAIELERKVYRIRDDDSPNGQDVKSISVEFI